MLEIGDEVRASLHSGLFVRGIIELETESEVKVRGRWFAKSDVKTAYEIETKNRADVLAARALLAEEAQAASEQELRPVPVIHAAVGDYDSFVDRIRAAGYTLYVRVRDDGSDTACSEYVGWTGGEELPDEAIYRHVNNDAWSAVEWRLRTKIEVGSDCPFPTADAGTLGRGFKGDPCGIIHSDGTLEVNWNCLVADLVRNGLRAQR